MSNTTINDSFKDSLSRFHMVSYTVPYGMTKCDYVELDKCVNLNPNNYNLIVMQLNIRSLLSHQEDLLSNNQIY